jgi:glycosyltransferase involved in cell wall biosynthesis
MTRGLRRLLADPDAAQRRSAQALADVEAYDWRRITDQYEACYEAAAEPAGSRRG